MDEVEYLMPPSDVTITLSRKEAEVLLDWLCASFADFGSHADTTISILDKVAVATHGVTLFD